LPSSFAKDQIRPVAAGESYWLCIVFVCVHRVFFVFDFASASPVFFVFFVPEAESVKIGPTPEVWTSSYGISSP